MNWTEQTATLMKAWTEAQKQIWSGFYDLAQGTGAGSLNSPMNFYDPSSWLKQVAEAWTKGGGGDTSQQAAGNIFASQTAMMQIMNLLTKAWQTVAPNVEAGKPWQPDFQKLMNQWMEQITGFPGRAKGTAENLAELTKSIGNWGPLLSPWVEFMNQAIGTGHFGQAMTGSTGFGKLLLLEQQGMQPIIGGLAELPRAGLTRETNAKIMRASDALLDLRKASLVYDLEVAKGIGHAVERTMERLADLSKKDKKINTVREVMQLWFQTADRTLTERFCSDEFIAIQNDMASAALTYKLRLRDVLDMVYQALDIPTRSEIDDAYRAIHDLKKEVRTLKKALHDLTASKASAKTPT
ncbi:MAG: poly(R)-hydroxyalkanoic acid synthase subunit PhaE [Candidatus Competibacteraceae bacterium]